MSVVANIESDFSLRKLRIAGVCLMGQLFGSSMLLIGPLSMLMLGCFYTRFFGMKAYGEIFGINMAVLSLIMGFSAPLVGILFDRTGSYDLALIGMIAGNVLAALLYLAIGRYRYTTDFKAMVAPERAAT